MNVSGGHLNPAVTLGFLVVRRIEPIMAGVHLVAQFIGAVAGALALRALTPADVFDAARGGGQSIATVTSATQAVFLEAIGAFFLTFAVFGTAVDSRAPKIGGFGIGLTVMVVILCIGPLTGASLNPARSFGPAIASGYLEGLAFYFIGPILGAVAAALVYDKLLMDK
jgi:MIP family channel proteins